MKDRSPVPALHMCAVAAILLHSQSKTPIGAWPLTTRMSWTQVSLMK